MQWSELTALQVLCDVFFQNISRSLNIRCHYFSLKTSTLFGAVLRLLGVVETSYTENLKTLNTYLGSFKESGTHLVVMALSDFSLLVFAFIVGICGARKKRTLCIEEWQFSKLTRVKNFSMALKSSSNSLCWTLFQIFCVIKALRPIILFDAIDITLFHWSILNSQTIDSGFCYLDFKADHKVSRTYLDYDYKKTID